MLHFVSAQILDSSRSLGMTMQEGWLGGDRCDVMAIPIHPSLDPSTPLRVSGPSTQGGGYDAWTYRREGAVQILARESLGSHFSDLNPVAIS